MAESVFLVRHAEVHNPDHVVYGSLPGFDLSARGQRQAEAAAARLAAVPVDAIISSPLQRAQRTAGIIAQRHRQHVQTDERLIEWGLSQRWQGTRWDDLAERFPGELEQYLAHSWDLEFSPESLEECGSRVAAAACEWAAAHRRSVVLVTHQDPLQAARIRLLGRPIESQRTDLPGHAAIVEFEPGGGLWSEVSEWEPPQVD